MTQKQLILFSFFFLATLITFNAFCMRGEADYVRSPLHKAAWLGNIQEASQILKKDPNPDKRDGDKNTPLHLAINAGHWHMAKFLLNRGANKNAQNADWNTPLHSAARWNRNNIATLLLEDGADYKIQNQLKELPSDIAKEFGHEEIAILLDDKAQRINEPMEDTATIFTSRSREAAAIRMMLEQARRKEAIAP